ncbi:hypothetical protein KJ903_04870 [Patescibacteria group bacterium]|nr:hypothetical protein [Patescibacteria group bacterium]
MDREIKAFDVIVVYSELVANSPNDEKYGENTPFSSKGRHEGYNDSYRYFLSRCQKIGLEAAFVSSKDIIGPGFFEGFWTYDKKWIRNYGQAHSQVLFDKFTPSSSKQKNKLRLLTADESVYMFSNRKIKDIFQNKLNTYKRFKEFAIPSVEINSPLKRKIVLAKSELDKLFKSHRNGVDFHDCHIVKDKTGVGGYKIYKVDFAKSGSKVIAQHYRSDRKVKEILSYILQPFINCNRGFVFGKYQGFIDLRVIILNNKIIQTYIRIAKKGEYKCNEHQGGNLVYMKRKTIPEDVRAMTKKIIKKLGTKLDLEHSLYSLDFIRSNNGNLYFLEGNSNPGIDWDHSKKINERKSKELINIIVDELKSIYLSQESDKPATMIPNFDFGLETPSPITVSPR